MSDIEWERAYRRFLDDPGDLRNALPWAKSNKALPIDQDGGVVVGLTADGQVLAHNFEPAPGAAPFDDYVITDSGLRREALTAGARRYPWVSRWLAGDGDSGAAP